MNVLYITAARLPTEKAHGVQIVKMCEAFQRQGVEVKLFVPTRRQSQAMKHVPDLWQHYDVETPFRFHYLVTPDFLCFENLFPRKLMRCLYDLQSLLFSVLALLVTGWRRQSLYYSRSLQTIFLLGLTKRFHRKKVFFEAHELHGDYRRTEGIRWLYTAIMRWMLRHVDGLIVITHQLKTLYVELGISTQRILVAPDGIDRKRFSQVFDKIEARQKLGISLDRKVICYTGHLFQWKGVYTLAESTRYLPEECIIYIVGGMESDILPLQRFIAAQGLRNITISGYVPYRDVPVYLSAADVLVLPNTATANISREYTSPLKLFEYMGARRPIVASDLPSFREVLRHQENAYLVRPDSPKHLAEGIIQVLNDQTLSEQMTARAYVEVQEYTWDKRAQTIIAFLKQNMGYV